MLLISNQQANQPVVTCVTFDLPKEANVESIMLSVYASWCSIRKTKSMRFGMIGRPWIDCRLSITQDNLAVSVCYERSVRLTQLVTVQRRNIS